GGGPPSTSGSSSLSDGSSPIQTTTYIHEAVAPESISAIGPEAYNCQRGLLGPQGRSSVRSAISASLQEVALPQRMMFVASVRSSRPATVSRTPNAGPSMKPDVVAPASPPFQSGAVLRPCLTRCMAPTAAYRASGA